MADEEVRGGELSEWLELMLAEISRRQEEAQAGDIEQAARALQPGQRSTSDEPQMTSSQPLPHAPSQPQASSGKAAAARAKATHRARSA